MSTKRFSEELLLGVSCHHPTDSSVGSQQASELVCLVKLHMQGEFKHLQKQMFFTWFVLVTIETEHHDL